MLGEANQYFTALALVGLTTFIGVAYGMFFKKKWDPKGKHCLVTGASSGTGLALAIMLAKKGASVSIVARGEEKLRTALAEVEKARQTPDQKFHSFAFAVNTEAGAVGAVQAACGVNGGRCPDAMFLCAGASRPGFFVEQDEASLRKQMDETYWAQALSALAGAKEMVRQDVKGKIVFCTSLLGYMSMVGYSPYSPGKHALRGLAESLQSEFILYDIGVHICFPPTIFTPGYEEENKVKPAVTLEIEATDGGLTPEQVAGSILKGTQNGDFHISCEFFGDVFRASTAGSSPRNSYVIDLLYGLIGYIALPIWRFSADSTVRKHRKEHHEHLRSRGFKST